MKNILVDSNIILDIVNNDKAWFDWSSQLLAKLVDDHYVLMINPIIYAEISFVFKTINELDTVLSTMTSNDFKRSNLPWEAAFLAEKRYVKYRKNGGNKTTLLPDFFIGAHAETEKLIVLTRDPRHYQIYFPHVKLFSPGNNPYRSSNGIN